MVLFDGVNIGYPDQTRHLKDSSKEKERDDHHLED